MIRGTNQQVWPVALLLLLAALVPSACVLWFMGQAVRNERLAVRQRLTDVYHDRLEDARNRIDAFWQNRADEIARNGRPVSTQPAAAPGLIFERLVSTVHDAFSVVLYDTDGHVMYPTAAPLPRSEIEEETPEWQNAKEMEHDSSRADEAAAAYAVIIDRATDANTAARALLAQARCLNKAGQTKAAVALLTGKLADDKYRNATDAQGRLIQCNAHLFALQLLKDPKLPEFLDTARAFIKRVTDYGDIHLSSSQRLFLMQGFQSLVPGNVFPTQRAEALAAAYLEDNPPVPEPSRLTRAPHGDGWCLTSADRTVVAIFPNADGIMQGLIANAVPMAGVDVKLQPPTQKPGRAPFITGPAGTYLPNWELVLYLNGADPFAAAAHQQVVMYAWTAGTGIVVIAIVGLLLARLVTNQIRLSRLKNDLVATVSHELKTPLASMRLLVDTLLDAEKHDEKRVSEYLHLISRENIRLTRLIDNFLAFSRMERNKHMFDFARVHPREIIRGAVDAVSDRFHAPGCRFEVQTPDALPHVHVDADAVITVLINLLDNAYKYSGSEKQITLRTSARNGNLCFDVIDNGIGMSPRAVRKVFKPFYQVDQRLSRTAGGCGLGLSIVQYIVAAHSGTVGVTSRPGEGSTFTVTLPTVREGGTSED